MKLAVFNMTGGGKLALLPTEVGLGVDTAEKQTTATIVFYKSGKLETVDHTFEEAVEIVNLALNGYTKEEYEEEKKEREELFNKMKRKVKRRINE